MPTVRLRAASEYPEAIRKMFELSREWFKHDFAQPPAMSRVMAWDPGFGAPHGHQRYLCPHGSAAQLWNAASTCSATLRHVNRSESCRAAAPIASAATGSESRRMASSAPGALSASPQMVRSSSSVSMAMMPRLKTG